MLNLSLEKLPYYAQALKAKFVEIYIEPALKNQESFRILAGDVIDVNSFEKYFFRERESCTKIISEDFEKFELLMEYLSALSGVIKEFPKWYVGSNKVRQSEAYIKELKAQYDLYCSKESNDFEDLIPELTNLLASAGDFPRLTDEVVKVFVTSTKGMRKTFDPTAELKSVINEFPEHADANRRTVCCNLY